MSSCSISRHCEVATPPTPPTGPSGTDNADKHDNADKQHITDDVVKYAVLASHTTALTSFKSIQYKSL